MRIGPFLSVVLVGIVGLFAWLVLRDGSGVSGDPGRRVAAAADADERRPPPAITPASAAPSREPERIEEEVGGGVEATGYAVGEGGDEDDAALHGDADLDVTTVVPEEDHWLWSQLPPKILVFRSRRDTMAPDFETLVTEERQRCAAMGETELRGVTEEKRPPTEAELRADVANNFDQIRREKLWGVAVARAVATLDEPAHVRGLAPGRCFVTLQRGDSPRHPRVFDEQVVELASGTNAVTLTLPLEEERPRVRIAGTIRYSSDWGGRGLRLDFDPASVAGATEADERSLMLSDQKPVEGSPDLYPFEIGDLRPGRYLVTSSTLD